ncbi:uncharacterized protein LY89DRAFT_139870 [Mollisia scopiformis]|uniref:Uncharacterized protein n=1 Tax=Mollisia scopiformis TaxID=149040 RepID=A0A194X3Q5_MOLSC|nr:uncharacterized protein LY89DRAFT_139870 [Mollisia scopiformis]KUJ14447.1 hypothetical protein LY89DRAFT_139870 [Mollisia scopiformis]
MQIIWDLHKVTSNSALDWPTEDIDRLNTEESIDLFYRETLYLLLYRDDPQPEYEELLSVMQYRRKVKREAITQSLAKVSNVSRIQRQSSKSVPNQIAWEELDRPSSGIEFYHNWIDPGILSAGVGFSPLRAISFDHILYALDLRSGIERK